MHERALCEYYADGSQKVKTTTEGKKVTVTTYLYDNTGRLQSEAETEGSVTNYSAEYTYDRFSNRKTAEILWSKNAKIKNVIYSYSPFSKLVNETQTHNNKTTTIDYQYDQNGSQTSRTTTENNGNKAVETSVYDGKGRLTQVTTGGVQTSYAYRPDELRHLKSRLGSSTTHAWDFADIMENGKELGRQFSQGKWGDKVIQFWYNYTTNTIETARLK